VVALWPFGKNKHAAHVRVNREKTCLFVEQTGLELLGVYGGVRVPSLYQIERLGIPVIPFDAGQAETVASRWKAPQVAGVSLGFTRNAAASPPDKMTQSSSRLIE